MRSFTAAPENCNAGQPCGTALHTWSRFTLGEEVKYETSSSSTRRPLPKASKVVFSEHSRTVLERPKTLPAI